MTELSTADKRAAALEKARAVRAQNRASVNEPESPDNAPDAVDEAPEEAAEPVEAVLAPTPAPTPAPAAKSGPLMIEVRLLKKYAPFKIINVDGELVDQGEVKETIGPGIVELEADEATRVLERKQAEPTANTFASLRGR